MSFDAAFDRRWTDVIAPGIRNVTFDDLSLEPFRVDVSEASGAILTEILREIGEAAVIVADVTVIGELNGRGVRNANVLYEIGLAHAARLPEEVVLFRSDRQTLDFDIAGVRVHSYDPDGDAATARQFVAETVLASLNALQGRQRASLRLAAQRLTLPGAFLLLKVVAEGRVRHPASRTVGEAIGAVERGRAVALLLELGAISASFTRITPELLAKLREAPDRDMPLLEYQLTSFGRALIEFMVHEMGAFAPEMRQHIARLIDAEPSGSG